MATDRTQSCEVPMLVAQYVSEGFQQLVTCGTIQSALRSLDVICRGSSATAVAQSTQACRALAALMSSMTGLLWSASGDSNQESEALATFSTRMALMTAQAGILPELEQLAVKLATLTASREWEGSTAGVPQVPGQAPAAVADLVQCVLQLFDVLLALWPGSHALYSPKLLPVALSMADLAAAALQHHKCFNETSSSPDSTSSCSTVATHQSKTVAVNSPTSAAVSCGFRIIKGLVDANTCNSCNSVFHCSCGRVKPMPAAIPSSNGVKHLLAVSLSGLALAAREELQERMEEAAASICGEETSCCQERQAESPHLRQVLLVPAYHQQLLSAVGMPLHPVQQVLAAFGGLDNVGYPDAITFLVTKLCYNLQFRDSPPFPQTAADRQQWRQWQQAACVPTLLVCVELAVLQCEIPAMLRSLMSHMSNLLTQAVCEQMHDVADVVHQVFNQLLPAVLQYMPPAVRLSEVILQRYQGEDGQVLNQNELFLQLASLVAGAFLRTALKCIPPLEGSPEKSRCWVLSAQLRQWPQQYCQLLEAEMRSTVGGVSGNSALVLLVPLLLSEATPEDNCSEGSSLHWICSAHHSQQRQVFSMLNSCLKLATVIASSSGAWDAVSLPARAVVEIIPVVISTTQSWSRSAAAERPDSSVAASDTAEAATSRPADVADCWSAASMSPITSGGSNSKGRWSWQRRLWCVLLARCLASSSQCCKFLQVCDAVDDSLTSSSSSKDDSNQGTGSAAAPAGSGAEPTALDRLVIKLALDLPEQWEAAVQQITCDLQAAVAAGDITASLLQQLLPQSEYLAQQQMWTFGKWFDCMKDGNAVAAKVACSEIATNMVHKAQQLEMFAAEVCAALPVQEVCNYHGCSNLAQLSELELVGGKSCVCGGCRVARYCSAQCQKEHWHKWHKPVCKRLQLLRQDQQQDQQPQL